MSLADLPPDEVLMAAGWIRSSRRERRILSRPRVKQYYWVDFPHDAFEPEFVGEHPGVVIRGSNDLHGTCMIVPVTSSPHADAIHIRRLSWNPNPAGRRSGIEAYVVCDHLYTVNNCRLRPVLSHQGKPLYPSVHDEDFKAICQALQKILSHLLLSPPPGDQAQSATQTAFKDARMKGPGSSPKIVGNRQILTLPKAKPLE